MSGFLKLDSRFRGNDSLARAESHSTKRRAGNVSAWRPNWAQHAAPLQGLSAIAAVLVALIAFGCAKDIAPPGGPADTAPPEILTSTPIPGAVNVSVIDPIVIEFTERINSKSVGNALFISPPLKEEPRLRVKGSRLQIIPADPLDSGKTYVVTLGASVSDLNGNKLKNSLTFAFSTGGAIDSSSITGRVFEKMKPLPNFRIFAFSYELGFTENLFGKSPDYITESGSDGQFKFDFIREGEYFVIGVEDKDRDNMISSYVERVAIPVTTAMALPPDMAARTMALHTSRFDSAMISLITCSGYDGRAVMQLSGKVDPKSVLLDSIDVLTSYREISSPQAAIIFDRETDKLVIWSTRFVEDSVVTITAHGLRGLEDKQVDTLSTECIIRIRGTDTEAPDIADRMAANSLKMVYPPDSLSILFTEPVTFPDSALAIIIDSNRTTTARAVAMTRLRFAILPTDTVPYDKRLKLQVNLGVVKDLFGNAGNDTLYTLDFALANPDSLGSLSGYLNFEHVREVTMRFTGLARKQEYAFTQKVNGKYSVTMYPDQYIVTAFSDQNHNGRWDHGALAPFQFAEPGWLVPDTLRIRARFDTEDFDLDLK